jgi:hypothetical protein
VETTSSLVLETPRVLSGSLEQMYAVACMHAYDMWPHADVNPMYVYAIFLNRASAYASE